ncbi:suppressor of fused domain protein [Nocardia sp. NPDC057353]|uniref:suppressor of fused domain protein n=1 Tax=Nocardia sp. NPDC057353 TaxID=3346104 RepID=UPI003624D751
MSETPGRADVTGALTRLYADAVPVYWAGDNPWSAGGTEPLDGISAYRRSAPMPHWHYVTHGLSGLFEHGQRFEFTMRTLSSPEATEPPQWPVDFLQNLSHFVFQSGEWFEPGDAVKSAVPLGGAGSALRAAGFVNDPELGTVGGLMFLQIVGLTTAEYRTARGRDLLDLLAKLEPRLPLYVTDVARDSLVPEPPPAARWPRWGGGLAGRP